MTWEIQHVRTRRVVIYNDASDICWHPPVDLPKIRLHGRHFDLRCPEHDLDAAAPLLDELDRWAERVDLDGRAIMGGWIWAEDDVQRLLFLHLDWWRNRPRGQALQESIEATAVVAVPHCPECGDPPLNTTVIPERCRDHELSTGGSADRQAEQGLQTSELVAGFIPGLTWAEINRTFCRFVHRDRDKMEVSDG